jgi:N-acetylmuramoyl-L-alanine amidase
MREINTIVVHCSASVEGQDVSAKVIDAWHKQRGFSGIGYHYVIRLDGSLEIGRPEEQQGAHVQNHNAYSLGICMVGGLDKNQKPKDTFTADQYATLKVVLQFLHKKYPNTKIVGHRDLSPDLDGDGIIQKDEWLKDCPCFDVQKFVNENLFC